MHRCHCECIWVLPCQSGQLRRMQRGSSGGFLIEGSRSSGPRLGPRRPTYPFLVLWSDSGIHTPCPPYSRARVGTHVFDCHDRRGLGARRQNSTVVGRPAIGIPSVPSTSNCDVIVPTILVKTPPLPIPACRTLRRTLCKLPFNLFRQHRFYLPQPEGDIVSVFIVPYSCPLSHGGAGSRT